MMAVGSLFSFIYVSGVRSDKMGARDLFKNPRQFKSLKRWSRVGRTTEKRGAQACRTIWDASTKET